MKGFTLLEMIVVMAVLIIMVAVLSQIFSNTLRGTNKAQVLASIKQNGQSVLEVIDKTIRQADKVICYSPSAIITFQNGTYTKFAFIDSVSTSPLKNGYIYQENSSSQNLNCDRSLFINPQILTDTDLITGVSIDIPSGGGFTVGQDLVSIKFNVSPGLGIVSSFSNQIDPTNFQTTVSLRGYTEIK